MPPPSQTAPSQPDSTELSAYQRRQLRRSQRRDHVYDAAVGLFTKQSYDGTTMDDIAKEAGVARTSVFNYFERKSAILDDWAARRRDLGFGTIRNPDEPLQQQLTEFMTGIAQVSMDTRDETVALFGPAVRELNLLDNSALAVEMTELIEHSGQPVADKELLGSVLATGYFAVLHDWCAGDKPPFNLGERLRQLVHLLASGFDQS
ncbi:hypothetical protein ASG90_01150 [Nocardioides sp. Soil797]|nr:hypothetical protein ASG90_01150 [Nocardioides sp. Soil797]